MARSPRPLDEERLRSLAMAYVARYATTTVKLRRYLDRKLREHGWHPDTNPPVDALIARCVSLGFVDDAGFARSRASGLARKGLGASRIRQDLRSAGLEPSLGGELVRDYPDQALERALVFARRRRIGPFSTLAETQQLRLRWIGQMARAGHGSDITRRVLAMGLPEAEELIMLHSTSG